MGGAGCPGLISAESVEEAGREPRGQRAAEPRHEPAASEHPREVGQMAPGAGGGCLLGHHPFASHPEGSSLGTAGRGLRPLLFLGRRALRTPCRRCRGEQGARGPAPSRRPGCSAGWRGAIPAGGSEPTTAGSSARLKRRPRWSPAPWRPAPWRPAGSPRRHRGRRRAVLAGHQLGAALMSGPCRDDFTRQASAREPGKSGCC